MAYVTDQEYAPTHPVENDNPADPVASMAAVVKPDVGAAIEPSPGAPLQPVDRDPASANSMKAAPPTEDSQFTPDSDPQFTPDTPTDPQFTPDTPTDPQFTPDAAAAPFPKEPDTAAMQQYVSTNIGNFAAFKNKPAPEPADPNAPVNPIPQPVQRPVEGWAEQIEAGWQTSIQGYIKRGSLPDKVLPQNAGWAARMMFLAGRFEGDFATMAGAGIAGAAAGEAAGVAAAPTFAAVGGAVAGPVGAAVAGSAALLGGPLLGAASAWGAPEGLRTALMMHYQRGDIRDSTDFMQRLGAITLNTMKAGTVGAVTELSGGIAGGAAKYLEYGQGGINAASTAAQVAAISTVGPAVEGHLPHLQNFLDSAFILGAFHLAAGGPFATAEGEAGKTGGTGAEPPAVPQIEGPTGPPSGFQDVPAPPADRVYGPLDRNTGNFVANKLMDIYAKTGVRPEEVLHDAQTDPVLKQDLLSSNVKFPDKYKPLIEMEQDGSHVFKAPEPKMIEIGSTPEMNELHPDLSPDFSGPVGIKVPSPEIDFTGTHVSESDGTPVRVYHGTSKSFEKFSKETFGSTTDSGLMGSGFYFSEDAGEASTYAKGKGGNVRPAFLNIQNPFDLFGKDTIATRDKILSAMKTLGMSNTEAYADLEKSTPSSNADIFPIIDQSANVKRDILKAAGFDGIKYGTKRGSRVWVALDESQIGGGISPPGEQPPAEPPSGGEPPPRNPDEEMKQYWTDRPKPPDGKPITWDSIEGSLSDDTHYVKQLASMLRGEKPKVPLSQNPQELLLRSRAVGESIDAFIKQPYDLATGKPIEGVKGAPAVVKNLDPDKMRNYLVAQAALQLSKREINTNIPLSLTKEILKNGKDEFAQPAKELVTFRNEGLKLLIGNYVDQAGYDAMAKANDRIPMYREPLETDASGKRVVSAKPKGIKGVDEDSSRRVVDPYVAIVKEIAARVGAVRKNQAAGALVRIYDEAFEPAPIGYKPTDNDDTYTREGVLYINKQPGLMREVHAKKIKVEITPELTAKYLEQNEIEGAPETPLETWIPGYEKLTDTQIDHWIDGKRRVFEVGPEVAAAFGNMNPTQAHLAMTIAKGFARSISIGQGHTPWFLVAHLWRQLQAAAIISPNWHIPLLSELYGAGHLVLDTEAAQQMKKSGLGTGTIINYDSDNIHDNILQLSKKTGILDSMQNMIRTPLMAHKVLAELLASKIRETRDVAIAAKNVTTGQTSLKDAANGIGNALLAPVHAIEPLMKIVFNSSKMAQFARDTNGDYSPESVARAVRNASRISFDPRKTGAKTQFMPTIAFVKAHTQANTQLANALFRKDERDDQDTRWASWMKLGGYTAASLALFWSQRHDQRLKGGNRVLDDLYARIAVDDWQNMKQGEPVGPFGTGDYRIGPDGKTIQKNVGTIFRIPRGTVGLPAALLERALSYYMDKLDPNETGDPNAFKGFADTIHHGILPDFIPNFAVPMIETMANESLLYGTPIVPANLEKANPVDRWNNSTSGAAKALSQVITSIPLFNQSNFASPMMIDNAVRSWTGSLGQLVLATADKILRAQGIEAPKLGATPTGGSNPFTRAFEVANPSFGDQRIQDFMDNFDQVQKDIASAKLNLKQGDLDGWRRNKDAAAKLGDFETMHKSILQQMTAVHMIDAMAETGKYAVSPDQKRQTENALITTAVAIAVKGLEGTRQLQKAIKK